MESESNGRRRRRHPPKPRRRDNNKPKVPNTPIKPMLESSTSPIAVATTTVHDVPDHVLEVIFLRLDSHASLVCAASGCKRWCRVVADAGFLRLFHPLPASASAAVRGPLILGHYYRGEPLVFEPSSSSSSTPSIRNQSSLFSLDFVPRLDGASWEIADSRGTGLLLLSKANRDWETPSSSSFNVNKPDLVVCRPLTRRYHAISSLPDRLTAGCQCLGLFLIEGGSGSVLSSFRVIAVLVRDHLVVPGRGVPVACVYDQHTPGIGTTNKRWCSWQDVSCTWSRGAINVPNKACYFHFAGRANGSLYWAISGGAARATALVLDEATTGVSVVELPVVFQQPLYQRSRWFRVIGAPGGEDDHDGGGAVSMRAVHLVANELRVYARLRVGDDWVLQNLLQLPVPEENTAVLDAWNAMIVAAHETYVLVTPRDGTQLFSVDLETMAVECVRQGILYEEAPAYPYELPWPPTLDVVEAAADGTIATQIQAMQSWIRASSLWYYITRYFFSFASRILG